MGTSHKMTHFADDLENWMQNLPPKIRSIPVINLAIPGSHDSMSYGITRTHTSVAPDATPVVDGLYKVFPCVIKRWAVTQKLTATQQLNCGIRYFDLRICLKNKDKNFYFVHGLYCEEITEPLIEIQQFLENHRNEFVILDCQHFYNFSEDDYEVLANRMIQIFNNNIYGQANGKLTDLTLETAEAKKTQVLIIYRSSRHIPMQFWPSDMWPTPWPNQIKISKLKKYLDNSLENRSPDCGFVTQCVVTPPVDFIVPRFFMSLRRACAERVRKGLFDWIKIQSPGEFRRGEQPTSNQLFASNIMLHLIGAFEANIWKFISLKII
ncbi:PI-PLC X domain-containing protein 3 [Pseudolycoriella hygida]|uniref:PI-PLC X domain-containing protein 3 n=1 Tax=Pseudolycoriella hygida TaxID=35572 RepID=A0A9Q0NDV8_9DIPT|nr:PI-PLC X domain-containing protein 3 [Pseudolycoriella hygida]